MIDLHQPQWLAALSSRGYSTIPEGKLIMSKDSKPTNKAPVSKRRATKKATVSKRRPMKKDTVPNDSKPAEESAVSNDSKTVSNDSKPAEESAVANDGNWCRSTSLRTGRDGKGPINWGLCGRHQGKMC